MRHTAESIAAWMDKTLRVASFDDSSNNGVQIEGRGGEIRRVAFAVDASLRAVRAAAEKNAGLLVVHHGISWGGGIKRIAGGVRSVVAAAIESGLAVYACHLPLDAHPTLGNNAGLARALGVKRLRKAFSYRGSLIGFVGVDGSGRKTGVCSGGAGEFAEEAKRLGCERFVTGETSWGEKIAAENAGIEIECLGHYETEVYGVRALAAKMAKDLKLETIDMTEELK